MTIINSVEWHDKLSARLEAHAAEMLEQFLGVHRLRQMFHDMRLGIYNALRSGNREEALKHCDGVRAS